MESLYHFYLTFNPYLNQNEEQGYTQAHEFYDLMKELVSIDPTATCYWGKMINKDRDASIDIGAFQEILNNNNQNHFSTHLFITDFQNLWVGKVKAVTQLIPKNANTLSFYKDKKVEVWFEISDFILLEHGHIETAKRISDLKMDNSYSALQIQGLSPFTTSVKYPCIIEDQQLEQYFDEFDQNEISHLVLKENPAILKSNAHQVLKLIHNFVLPEEIYAKIPHAAKLEIETAEIDMLEQRHHNIHKIAFSYLRALEVIMNDLIIHHIKRKGQAEDFYVDTSSAPPKIFLQPSKDYFVTLKEYNKNFSINTLLHFVDYANNQSHLGFKKAFSEQKEFIRFILKDFTDAVKNNHLIEIRNALAHGENEKVSHKDAIAVRNIILGCGTQGLISTCYALFYKEKFQHFYEVSDFHSNQSKDNKKGKLKLVG